MTEDEILKRYGRGGILTHLPTKHEARMEVLAWVAAPIRPGVTYRESEINDLLRGHRAESCCKARGKQQQELRDSVGGRKGSAHRVL